MTNTSGVRRYLHSVIQEDLASKMVFLGGPRQVGKTSLGKQIIPDARAYLNWDIASHREQILQRRLPATDAWFFDEIHKYTQWRNYLKGLYDEFGKSKPILVTGSARLDFYRYGGDSLQGRYHYLRLHPLTVAELGISSAADFTQLLTLGGFPEPFFSGELRAARRWSREYRERLVREDIPSLERIDDIGKLELLCLRLPDLVGSPLSINGLREDLQVAHKTAARWFDVLERIYALFRLSPFGAPKIRAVKKEQKHYHFDWSILTNEGARFENLVACHLLKWVQFQQDTQGLDFDLRYFRDIDGREVDFVITQNNQPVSFVECKLTPGPISKGLYYLKQRFPEVDAWQIFANGDEDSVNPQGIRQAHAARLLRELV
jgi:uncharacterized protein